MYNLYHKQHPCKLNQYFTQSNVKHSRPTRYSTSLMFTIPFMQWCKSVKIIGGDETEPSKVAHIKKRIVA